MDTTLRWLLETEDRQGPAWVQGLIQYGVYGYRGHGPGAMLREYPALLAQVHRLFEVEGEGEGCLAGADKYTQEATTWRVALLELVASGGLAREEVLDWTVAALGRGFSSFRAGWFSRFHDALEPSPAETTARQEAYRALLASEVGPTVALALRALAKVAAAGGLEGPATVAALEPAARTRSKGTARRSLKLAARVAGPGDRAALVGVAAHALGHPAREVQEDALALLEEHAEPGDPDVAARAGEAAAGVAPTLRERVAPWMAAALPEPELAVAGEEAELSTGVDAVRPVADHGELGELLVAWLKAPEDPLEFERALDGAARLGAGEAAAPALAKVARRAWEAVRSPGAGEYPDLARGALAQVAHRVATGEVMEASGMDGEPRRGRVFSHEYADLPEMGVMLARRARAVGEALGDGARLPLLALPTHRPAWVAPGTLVERIQRWEGAGRSPPALEVAQALLRLGLAGRVGAAREARGLRSEAGRALRYALGENLDIGADPVVWVAAGQARSPGRPPPEVATRHPGLGPGADAPAAYAVEVEVRDRGDWTHRTLRVRASPPPAEDLDPEILPVLVHTGGGRLSRWQNRRVAGFTPAEVRRAGLVTPADQEWYFAEGARTLDPEWHSAQWEVVEYLGPLLWPDLRPGPMGHLLLVLALGAKEKGQRAAGAQALVTGAAEKRLEVSRLARWARELLETEYLLVSRFTRGLEEACRGGAAVTVRELLEAVAPGLAGAGLRGTGGMLELWLELQVAADAGWSGAAEGVEAASGRSGKIARAARALLARREA